MRGTKRKATTTMLCGLLLLVAQGPAIHADKCDLHEDDWIPFGDVSWVIDNEDCSFIVRLVDVGGLMKWTTDEVGVVEVELHADLSDAVLANKAPLAVLDLVDPGSEQLAVLELLEAPGAPPDAGSPLHARLLYRTGDGQLRILYEAAVHVPRSAVSLQVRWRRGDVESFGSVELWADLGRGMELLARDDSLVNFTDAVRLVRVGGLGVTGGPASGEAVFSLGPTVP